MSMDGIAFGTSGGSGGVHAGYDIQTGVLVYGIEADAALGGIEGSGTDGGDEPTLNSKVTWLATVRGRVGYAFDRFLVYATGGVAFAGGTLTVRHDASRASDRQTHIGWTVGGGVEYAIDDNWSAGLEYRYVDLGRRTYVDAAVIGGTANIRLALHTLMARLSYRF
jgi:outer membrane immunogenic protein